MSGSTTPGGQVQPDIDAFVEAEPGWAQQVLYTALAVLDAVSEPLYIWTSMNGQSWGEPNDFDLNVAVAVDPATGDSDWLPQGYKILIAEGVNPVNLVDWSIGNALLIGNAGNDSITSTAQGDTMIGAVGANTVFWAQSTATMVGGGNDLFVSNDGNVDITTSDNGLSVCWLGAAQNLVTLNGSDTVACNESNDIANDTVVSAGNAGDGCLIVGPDLGQLYYECGPGPASIVGHAGTLMAIGGAGHNIVLGGTGYLGYIGGTGQALVIGESGMMSVEGGAGAITVFGGTGVGRYSAQPGGSNFVVGDGPSTVTASAGNLVWLVGGANVSVASGGAFVWGANSSGNNIFQAGAAPTTLVGGMGSDLFLAGTGNATLDGGSGAETFSFTNGEAGGHDELQNFAIGRDLIALQGYAESPAAILAAETVSGGSTSLVLSDGTHITLSGVTGLTAASFTA